MLQCHQGEFGYIFMKECNFLPLLI